MFHDDRAGSHHQRTGAARRDALRRASPTGCRSLVRAGASPVKRVPTLDEAVKPDQRRSAWRSISRSRPDEARGARTSEAALAGGAARWPSSLPPPMVSEFRQRAPCALPPHRAGLAARFPDRCAAGRLGRRQVRLSECATMPCDSAARPGPAMAALEAARLDVLAYTVNDPARCAKVVAWASAVFSDCPSELRPTDA